MSTWRRGAAWPPLLVVCALVALGVSGRRAPAGAVGLTAEDDDRVLERLPERDRALREAAAARPEDPEAAAALARDLVRRARAASDPRFLGRAQAVLARWWDQPSPPHDVLVLRATIRQSLHDFTGALRDLDEAVRQDPADGQAWITRATVLQLLGKLDEARVSCRGLVGLAHPLIATACVAGVDGAAGRAREAATVLGRALDRAGREIDAATRGWALTTLGEVLARLGDPAAETRYREALVATPDDAYLLASYADFLLDAGRRADAARLLDGQQTDALLLRRAIAEGPGSPLVAELEARFEALRARNDRLHQREEARYLLELAGRPAEALPLAVSGFAAQREPADVRLLLAAALAAGDPAAARPALDHVRQTGLEDPHIAALVRRVEAAR